MKQTARNSLLAISIGLVYLWFGVLKFFPHLSPAEGLAKNTIHTLTFELIPDGVSIVLLALWETCIGVFLIFNIARKTTALAALVHMLFTFTPLLFFPDEVFNGGAPYLTLLEQYIIKNLIIIAALLVLLPMEMTSITAALKNTAQRLVSFTHFNRFASLNHENSKNIEY